MGENCPGVRFPNRCAQKVMQTNLLPMADTSHGNSGPAAKRHKSSASNPATPGGVACKSESISPSTVGVPTSQAGCERVRQWW